MQTVIQVITTGRGSLRNKIMSDAQLEKKFGFIKVWAKQPGRPHGWAKIHSETAHGANRLHELLVKLRSELGKQFHVSHLIGESDATSA